MNKFKIIFKKLLKWFFVIFLGLLILLIISVYISSLNSYKESDFNIPKDFFDTKFGDRDSYSDENGFSDLVEFIDLLNKNDFSYFDTLSRCIFDEEYIEKGSCETDKERYLLDIKLREINNYFYKRFPNEEEKFLDLQIRKVSFFLKDIEKEYNIKINGLDDLGGIMFPSKIDSNYLEAYIKGLQYFEENKEEIIDKEYIKFRNLVNINKIKYKKINNKEYILQTPEYSGIYTGDNVYGGGETLVYTSLMQYSRGLRYVVYKYFENGDYEKGLEILLEYQKFIDNLMNKTDSSLIQVLVYFTMSSANLEAIDYFLDNYELSDNLKNKIKIALETNIDNLLIENTLKNDHIVNRSVFQYLYDSSFDKDNYIYDGNIFSYYKGIIEAYLFYSVEESEVLTDKVMYDVINNQGEGSDFYIQHSKNINKLGNNYFDLNINNYVGRILISGMIIDFSSQYQKEQDLMDLRQSILDKLK